MKKTITFLMMFMLLQIAASAQTVIRYEYDYNGNRYQRWMGPPHQVAPPHNSNTNNTTVAEDVNYLLHADSLSMAAGATATANEVRLTEGDIKVFPNPVQEKLNVQFKGTATPEGCSLQLFDGSGKLFYSEGSMKTLTEINMQQAKTGVYFLVVVDKEGKRLYWKLVKE